MKITKDNFKAVIAEGVTLVDFFATWCGPCRMLAPTLEELEKEYEGKAKVGKIDVDEEPELANLFGISSIPTLILFKDGKAVEKTVGLCKKEKLCEMLDKVL